MNLQELLCESCVQMDMPYKTKQEVFAALADCLYRQGIIDDPQTYIQAVEYRETLSETGLEDGIAIPHGISPCVKKAAIAYMHLHEPIPWESMDGKPIEHVFLLAIPEGGDKIHIRMLSELAMKLVGKETRQALNHVTTSEELFRALA